MLERLLPVLLQSAVAVGPKVDCRCGGENHAVIFLMCPKCVHLFRFSSLVRVLCTRIHNMSTYIQ